MDNEESLYCGETSDREQDLGYDRQLGIITFSLKDNDMNEVVT